MLGTCARNTFHDKEFYPQEVIGHVQKHAGIRDFHCQALRIAKRKIKWMQQFLTVYNLLCNYRYNISVEYKPLKLHYRIIFSDSGNIQSVFFDISCWLSEKYLIILINKKNVGNVIFVLYIL